MGFEALAWAARQKPGSAGQKLVLLGLAECASRPEGFAWPSIAALIEFSALDRKTVISNLGRLESAAPPYIEDTGERRGRTRQIKVYRLRLERGVAVPESIPKSEQSPNRNSSEFDAERVPETGHGTCKGISHRERMAGVDVNPDGSLFFEDGNGRVDFPGGLDADGWAGFVEMRVTIKEPLSPGAVKAAAKTLRRLADAGEDVAAVVEQSVLSNYRGLFALKGGRDGRGRGKGSGDNGRSGRPGNSMVAAAARAGGAGPN